MYISYDYYRTFYCVAKYGSFTKAAGALMSNQPNVTRIIRNLEAELDCPLFVRSNRGVTLTPEGQKLYEYVSSAVDLLQKGEEALKLYHNLQAGFVSLGVTETVLHGFLLPALREYRRKYPGIRIKISNYSTPEAVDAVRHRLVDFALVTTPVEVPRQLQEIRLSDFREILVGGTDFQPLREQTLRFSDLRHYPLIGLLKTTATFAFYNKLFAENGLLFSPDMEAATVNQLLLMIKENLGIGFLPERFAMEAVESGEVVRIPFAGSIPLRHISMIRLQDRPFSIAAEALVKMLLEARPRQNKETSSGALF